ncbi:hypothetical protein [Hymenobacter sp. CRA2]|uniref:hypothetical protein n=1 Tax=Hymenobacter sp. CRA2 TaxID=1955620 RepID=UPI00098FBF90|nr:hypothetical protein [Hymenobacter sp. CRA2]OON68601.1 hypothetical protein B0919_13255 [Hymenobacter sp. CRA2]
MPLSTLRLFKTALTASSLALLGACAPSYFVLVKPAATNGRLSDGMEVVASKADSLDVRLGVVSTTGQWLEFDVTVQNRSTRPVVVAPETFYLDAYGATSGGTVVATAPLRVQAENPERNIQTLQQQAQYHEQKSTARPAGEMLSSLANLIDDFSGKRRRETEQQRTSRETNRQAEVARYEQERTNHAVQAASAREEARQLEANLLRKTTVAPGYALRGRVRFRRYTDAATRLRVVTPVAGRELAAEFSQQRFRLDGHQLPTAQSAPAKRAAPASRQR